MPKMVFTCPKHGVVLHAVEGHPEALVHYECSDIFTAIDGNLCTLKDGRWHDVKTNKERFRASSRN